MRLQAFHGEEGGLRVARVLVHARLRHVQVHAGGRVQQRLRQQRQSPQVSPCAADTERETQRQRVSGGEHGHGEG